MNGPSPVFPVDAVASASILSLLFLLRSVSAYVRAPFLLPGGVQKVYPDLRPGKLFWSSFLRLSAKECCAFLLKCLAHMGWLALNIHLSYGALLQGSNKATSRVKDKKLPTIRSFLYPLCTDNFSLMITFVIDSSYSWLQGPFPTTRGEIG